MTINANATMLPSHGRGRRYSFAAVFLTCMAILYVLVLGTQFKMMSILGNHHEAIQQAGGQHDHHHGVAKMKTNKAINRKAGKSNVNDQTRNLNVNLNINAPKDNHHPADLKDLYESMSKSIAQKWNLTSSPAMVGLLVDQFYKENDYNPRTDYFHFHHLYKSGGTSISSLMDKTVGGQFEGKGTGPLPDRYEGILPGSYQSGNFDHEEALEDINRRLAEGTKREDLPYRASYAHTGLRPMYGPKRTKTGEFLLKHLPIDTRYRAIAMLRDPLDFRASNHAMIMCGLNYEVSRFNNERAAKGLERVCRPKDGLSISALVDRKIGDLMKKCEKADEEEAQGRQSKLNQSLRNQCRQEKKGVDTRDYCRSAAHLLNSSQYDGHYRSMFKGLMGRFHYKQEFTNKTVYGRMGYGFESAEKTDGYSVEAVEEYTLKDLGGLDTKINAGGSNPPEPDFIWFGITERMTESTTLYYYYFKAKPLPKTPIHRIQDCRPNSWWTEEDRAIVKEREPADYAVWRAANAIMDVRMEKMKMEIQSLLDAGETKETLFYVDWDKLEEIGVVLKGNMLVVSS